MVCIIHPWGCNINPVGGGIASVGPTPKKVLAVHPVFNSVLGNENEVHIDIFNGGGYS